MTYTSTVVINKEGKWYVARSVELGVTSQGKTIPEAQKNLIEAVQLYLEDSPVSKKNLKTERPLVTTIDIQRA